MRESRKPKRRNHVALGAALRRGGPHDTEPTRAEAERAAIAEQLFDAGAELDRAAQMEARVDAALAECARLREEAVAHAERASELREQRMYVVEGRAYRVEHALLRAKREAADRIERALRGEP